MTISPDMEQRNDLEDLASWAESLDYLQLIPQSQYDKFEETSLRPMPVQMKMTYSSDRSSIMFYWEQSYVLYNLVSRNYILDLVLIILIRNITMTSQFQSIEDLHQSFFQLIQ